MFMPVQQNKQSLMQLQVPPSTTPSGANNHETDSQQNEIMIVENSSMVLLGSSNNARDQQLKSSCGTNPLKVSDSASANNSSMNAYQLNFGTVNSAGFNQ